MDFEKLTNVMRRLALVAGDQIMEIYNAETFEVRTKSDNSPVTEADEAADAIISAGLRAEFPSVTLVTEQYEDLPIAQWSRVRAKGPNSDLRRTSKPRGHHARTKRQR